MARSFKQRGTVVVPLAESPIPMVEVESIDNPAIFSETIAGEGNITGLIVYGKNTQESTTGAQLFPINKAASANRLTVTHNEDGTINITGTPSAKYANILSTRVTLQPGTYYLSSNGSTSAGQMTPQVIVEKADETTKYIFGGSFTIKEGDNLEVSLTIQYQNAELTAVNLSNYFVMLNAGSTALPFEPYTGGKPSPSPEYPQPIVSAGDGGSIDLTVSDGADRSQSLTLSTPNGLPGIPVDSGGNHTDAEGQQWICDVKDYGTGKYTQMVGHIESYNGENITTPYMSTTGQLSIGAEVYYVLDEPVVTDISADELAAYRALHTYDGTTVISVNSDPIAPGVKTTVKVIDPNSGNPQIMRLWVDKEGHPVNINGRGARVGGTPTQQYILQPCSF